MKTQNISESVRLLLMGGTVIMVCVLCAVGFKVMDSGKAGSNTASKQLTAMQPVTEDLNVSVYEDSIIKGSEVESLVKKVVEAKYYLALEVATLDGATLAYNYRFDPNHLIISQSGAETELPADKSSYGYVNTSANFKISIFYDKNNNMICLRFDQQK